MPWITMITLTYRVSQVMVITRVKRDCQAKDAELAVPFVKDTQPNEIVELVLKQLGRVCAPFRPMYAQ